MPALLNRKRTRFALAAGYFVVAFGILGFYISGNPFCEAARTGQSRPFVAAKLAFACTAWNLFASACARAVAAMNKSKHAAAISIVASTIVAGLGFFSLPSWIYRGYGTFLSEHTWADVSCVFTEGYGVTFLFFMAPLLTVTTLLCEWLISGKTERS
jgi:hypothetical protein